MNAGRNIRMFSDPWIIGGAGVCLALIAIAAGFRMYSRINAKFEAKAAAKTKSSA